MKNVKMFFGVSCLVIAIGSAVATKAMVNLDTDYYQVYSGSTPIACVEIPDEPECLVELPVPCYYVDGGISYKEFENRLNTSVCVDQIFKLQE